MRTTRQNIRDIRRLTPAQVRKAIEVIGVSPAEFARLMSAFQPGVNYWLKKGMPFGAVVRLKLKCTPEQWRLIINENSALAPGSVEAVSQ